MSDSYWLAAASAFWLGILTSVSPCPLATNIAAVTYIGRHVSSQRRVISAGMLYAAGRMLTYVALGIVITGSVVSAVAISNTLQTYMNRFLGPLLILVGMVLVDLLRVPLPSISPGGEMQDRIRSGSLGTALLVGALFALSFCPVSAALFFGSLIPLAINHQSLVAMPALYGIGTGLPVLVLGIGLGLGARWVAAVTNRLPQIERWARFATGAAFILIGLYLSAKYIFDII